MIQKKYKVNMKGNDQASDEKKKQLNNLFNVYIHMFMAVYLYIHGHVLDKPENLHMV